MYSDIDAAGRRRISAGEFAAAYRNALTTATASGELVSGHAHGGPGGVVTVPVQVHTRLFGRAGAELHLQVQQQRGRRHADRVDAVAGVPGPA